MPAASPQDRVLVAQIAVHESWANTPDRAARTAPARKAFIDQFERAVDPEGVLDPAERAVRAEHARRAHYKRLALKSVQSRRRSKEATATAEAAEAELHEVGGPDAA